MSTKQLRIPTALAVAFALAASTATADEREKPQTTKQPTAQSEEGLPAMTDRASRLIGMHVKNSQGEDLGEIEDLVVDLRTGRIRYAAVAHGGILEIGEKLFAVPWNALKSAKNDDGERLLVLDVQKTALKNAPGFNEDNWPDFASREFVSKIESFYRPLTEKDDRTRERERPNPQTNKPIPNQPKK